ncbi:hypothetical protein JZU71_05120, partial [bacterium]|nr:hypothetical protein [bacterium]
MANCLVLGFPHFLNELGEPDPHLHLLTFAPAWDQEGIWRTRDNAAFLRQVQGTGLPIAEAMEVCGRRLLTDRLIKCCRSLGIEVELNPVFSHQE